jgi:hypothetical protein
LVIEVVDEERHLSYRWATFIDAPTRVETDLEPVAEGTRVSISESPIEVKAQARLALR